MEKKQLLKTKDGGCLYGSLSVKDVREKTGALFEIEANDGLYYNPSLASVMGKEWILVRFAGIGSGVDDESRAVA